jgi:hypothetical protein
MNPTKAPEKHLNFTRKLHEPINVTINPRAKSKEWGVKRD